MNDKNPIEEMNAKALQDFEEKFQNDFDAFERGEDLSPEATATPEPSPEAPLMAYKGLSFEELENISQGKRAYAYYEARAKAYYKEHHKRTDHDTFLDQKQDAVRIVDKHMKGLNKILNGGITYGKLYTLGADTSLGKTAFTLQLVKALANQNFPTLYFALEMDAPELDAILLSNQSYIIAKEENKDLTSISNNGDYNDDTKEYNLSNGYTLTRQDAFSSLLKKQLEKLTNDQTDFLKRVKIKYKEIRKNIFLMDSQEIKLAYPCDRISAKEIIFLIKNFIELYNIKPFVVIDYLQLLTYDNLDNNKVLSTAKNVNDLKEFALASNIPIWAISSLNRAGNKQPIQLESFKESGDIEYTADIVLGLQLKYFEEYCSWILATEGNERKAKSKISDYYQKSLSKETRSLEIVSIKNRQGERFQKLEIEYNPAYNNIEVSSYYSLKDKTDKQKAILVAKHIKDTQQEGEKSFVSLIADEMNNGRRNKGKNNTSETEEPNAERDEQEEQNKLMEFLDMIKNVNVSANEKFKKKQDDIKEITKEIEDWSELAKHSPKADTLSYLISKFYNDNINNEKKYGKGTPKIQKIAKAFFEWYCEEKGEE